MAEILTESFCERCGTRYTFESTAPRRRLGSFRTLSRGLKNFVLSDDTSLDDALAAARSDLEREATAQQLDAFHKTFNFCMSCRQYTCANCWNEVEGRCLTCAPHLGHEILPAPFPDMAVGEFGNGHVEQPYANGHAREELEVAWPTSDLEQIAPAEDIAPAQDVLPEKVPEPIDAPTDDPAEVEPVAAEPAEAEPIAAEPVEAEPVEAEAAEVEAAEVEPVATESETTVPADAEPIAPPVPSPTRPTPLRRRPTPGTVDDRAAAAASATADLLARFRPGQSIDAALEAFEAEQARREADASAGAPLEVQPAQGPAPDDLAVDRAEPRAAAEPEPTEVLAEDAAATDEDAATLDPVPAPADSPVAAAPPNDRVEVPSWRIVAPEQQPRAADGHPAERPPTAPPPSPAPSEWPAVPQWPARPEEPGGIAAILAARSASGGSSDALWAASSQEVIAPPSPAAASTGVQSCVSCGLSLSATARFCRRCGTRQGG